MQFWRLQKFKCRYLKYNFGPYFKTLKHTIPSTLIYHLVINMRYLYGWQCKKQIRRTLYMICFLSLTFLSLASFPSILCIFLFFFFFFFYFHAFPFLFLFADGGDLSTHISMAETVTNFRLSLTCIYHVCVCSHQLLSEREMRTEMKV